MPTHIKRPVNDKNAAFEKEARQLLRGVMRRRKCSLRQASKFLNINNGYASLFLKKERGINHAMRLAVMQARERERKHGKDAYYLCNGYKHPQAQDESNVQIIRLTIGNMQSYMNYLQSLLPKDTQ